MPSAKWRPFCPGGDESSTVPYWDELYSVIVSENFNCLLFFYMNLSWIHGVKFNHMIYWIHFENYTLGLNNFNGIIFHFWEIILMVQNASVKEFIIWFQYNPEMKGFPANQFSLCGGIMQCRILWLIIFLQVLWLCENKPAISNKSAGYLFGNPLTSLEHSLIFGYLIPSWIINHMPSKLWDEITHPFPNFNSCSWSLRMDK